MNIPTVDLLGISLAKINLENTLSMVDNAIQNGTQIRCNSINAHKLVSMEKEPAGSDDLRSTHLLYAQGKALFWASKILNKHLPENFTNQELMFHLVERARNKDYKIYFLGENEKAIKRLTNLCEREYHKDIVAGFYYDKLTEEIAAEIALEVHLSGANILLLDLNEKNRNKFLKRNKNILSEVNMIVGEYGDLEKAYNKLSGEPSNKQFSFKSWKTGLAKKCKSFITENIYMFKLLCKELTHFKPT